MCVCERKCVCVRVMLRKEEEGYGGWIWPPIQGRDIAAGEKEKEKSGSRNNKLRNRKKKDSLNGCQGRK